MADMVAYPTCRRLTAVTSRGNLWIHNRPDEAESCPNGGKPPNPPSAE